MSEKKPSLGKSAKNGATTTKEFSLPSVEITAIDRCHYDENGELKGQIDEVVDE